MTAALLALALAAAPARAKEESVECPSGTHRISTDNPYEPFRCVKAEAEGSTGLGAVAGPKGFEFRPRCPRGTRPAAATNALQPYRCVRAEAAESDPELAPLRGDDEAPPAAPAEAEEDPARGCPKGKRRVRTNDPMRPYECVVQAVRLRTLDEGTYARFAIPRQISFEYPRPFRVQDAWKEEVPTLYLTLDSEAAGKPVTITITRNEQSQSTFQELEAAIERDIDWQGAQDGGSQPVAGVRARVTYVPGDSRSVYLRTSKESYYSIVYSAPAEAYEAYLPAFQRLLKSLRLGSSAR